MGISEDGLETTEEMELSVIGDTNNHFMYSNSIANTDAWVDMREIHTNKFYSLFQTRDTTSSENRTN